jgi:hypothetical protein
VRSLFFFRIAKFIQLFLDEKMCDRNPTDSKRREQDEKRFMRKNMSDCKFFAKNDYSRDHQYDWVSLTSWDFF